MNRKKILLEIKDLHVSVNNIKILKGLNLLIYNDEVHAIMGPNGSGKSTLSKVIVGHPAYKIEKGEIFFKGKSIIKMSPEERSHLGLFLAFQYPVEVSGVSNEDFLRFAYNARQRYLGFKELSPIEFLEVITPKLELLSIKSNFLFRNVNEGFSGGEKKRNEILQLALLNSQLGILDETDSGLDIDALKVVADGIAKLINNKKSLILITHYRRLLDYIKPNFVHVMENGRIVKTGDITLVEKLESQGYGWLVE
uniref:sulfate ABC transporter protein n=1 Tax=Haramonas pauciplastida TaxID=478668 RepID=UPI00211435F2|nr:sulfate ABC transporter protein [Haramonas pauciplastida]UTE94995.1 sulfate ABC transporter protein [Haramonas pauciplastida]